MSTEADSYAEARPMRRQDHGDLLSTTITHTRNQLLVDVSFASLDAPSARSPWYRLEVSAKTEATEWVIDEDLRGPPVLMLAEPFGEEVACGGLEHDINYRTDRVLLRVPRTCLADPAWVRANVVLLSWRGAVTTVDDVHANGFGAGRTRFSARVFMPGP